MAKHDKRIKAQNRKLNQSHDAGFFDFTLMFIVIFLICFGLVMLYSTSSYEANLELGDSAYYLRKQIIATGYGFFAMFAAMIVPYTVYDRFAKLAYVVACVLLLAIIPFGHTLNGAKRWLFIGGMSLQPAEVAKLCVIVFFASTVCRLGRRLENWKVICIVMAMVMPIAGMIWGITSNASSAIIVVGIVALMVFVASPNYKFFVAAFFGGGAVGGLLLWWIVSTAGSGMGYRGARVLAWLDPEAYASTTGFQTLQALYAIGSGGIFGKGLGQSMQKLGFIPEAQNDMVFSIICEELGLFGAAIVMGMFLILIWRFIIIANNAPDLFGGLIVVGVMGHIAIQVILNIAVVTNIIPNTGISLPFISYGGTSVVFLMAEIGMVLSVARGIRLKDLE